MTEFFIRVDSRDCNDLSLVIEDEGKVCYAYLRYKKILRGDIWLYNQAGDPVNINFTNKNNFSFLNPQYYIKDDVRVQPLLSEDDVKINWVFTDEAMTNLSKLLELKKTFLHGRVATEEAKMSIEKLKDFKGILDVLYSYEIIDHTFKLDQEKDISGRGGAMNWLSPGGQIEEAFDFYPGIIAINKGLLPVGECLMGSGDPYFIKKEGEAWNLYRVFHDASEDSSATDMSELVCSLEALIDSLN
jgi:hypothetical protein